jgi:ribose transport system permease protein
MIRRGLLPLLIALLAIAMVLVEPRFFNRINLINLGRNFSLISIAALAQTLVMIIGGFDISIGAIVALSSVVAAITMTTATLVIQDAPAAVTLLGIAAALLAGGTVGLFNGCLVAFLQITPFMATLGTASIVLGVLLYITKGVPVYGMPESFIEVVGRSAPLGLPLLVWIAVSTALIVWVLLAQTAYGQRIYAVGGNPSAARASGIKVNWVTVSTYGLAGLLAALLGIVLAARIGSGQSTIGTNTAIESIAAAVLGGVSLRGGIGSIPRVLLASLFLAMAANALNIARIDSKWQTFVLGAALILAVAIEVRTNRGKNHGQ